MFEVLVKTASNVYQAGSMLIFLRVSQGSAVIATRTQNGETERERERERCLYMEYFRSSSSIRETRQREREREGENVIAFVYSP